MESSLKKQILIGIVSVAALLLLAAAGYLFYFKSEFIVYQDNEYKFSIKYPRTWTVQINPQPNVAVLFLRPKDTALDTTQEDFNVTIQPLPESGMSLEAFSAAVKRQMTGVFKNSKLVEYKPIQWGWRQGYVMAMEDEQPGNLKLVNAWVLRGDQAYILTFLGNIDKNAQDAPIIDEMIRSFQLQ